MLDKTNEESLSRILTHYVKILYSPSYAKKLFSENSDPLVEKIIKSATDKERLYVEHYARYKNFCSHIKMSLTLVAIPNEIVDMLSKEYCDSESFWIFKGRSLLENFCLFSYQRLLDEKNFLYAECMKFQGIVAGLKHQPLLPSPWDNEIVRKDNDFIETYHSPYKIYSVKYLDSENKNLPHNSPYEISITVSLLHEGVKIYEKSPEFSST